LKSIAVLSLIMAVLVGLAVGWCLAADPGTLAATVTTEGLPFPCIAGAACKVTLEYANTSDKDADLKDWSVSCMVDGNKVEASVDPGASESVQASKSATAVLTITLPESAGGKDVVLACSVNAAGQVVKADIPLSVTPIFEITLLPQRLILDPAGPKTLGMSVINHMDKQFTGKVTITANGGLSVDPSEITANIDALGLEPYMISIAPAGKLVPGHYTLWVDVGGKSKEWAMIDMPAVAASETVKVDGKLDEWKDVQSGSISSYNGSKYSTIGSVWFAYDTKNVYVAIEADEGVQLPNPDTKTDVPGGMIEIAVDPLIDGAKDTKGGFKDDDRAYALVAGPNGAGLRRTQIGGKSVGQDTNFPVAVGKRGASNIYETAIPWTEFTSFDPGPGKMIAIGVLVNAPSSYNLHNTYEFGGGLAGNIDPRLFVPVVLGK